MSDKKKADWWTNAHVRRFAIPKNSMIILSYYGGIYSFREERRQLIMDTTDNKMEILV